MAIQTKVETITPGIAKKYLEKMVSNRPLSQTKSLEYAIAIDEGKWTVNGETIKFNGSGKLFDGQHRLAACIIAEKPFKSLVIRGITDPASFATVDVGKSRSHSDIFSIAGLPNAAILSGAAYIVFLLKNDMVSAIGVKSRRYTSKEIASSSLLQKLKIKPVKASRVTKDELLAYIEPFKLKLIESMRYAEKFRGSNKSKIITASQGTGLHYLFSEKSKEDADRFIADLFEGVGLMAHDPVYKLRERLIANQMSPNKLTREAVLFLTVKAWGKRRNGEKVGTLKIAENEAFPKIV